MRILSLLLLAFLLLQCKRQEKVGPNQESVCLGDSVSYKKDIVPIMVASCNACHGPYNTTGYSTFSFEGLKTVAQSGQLYGAINHTPDFISMPLRSTLDTCSILKISKWVNQGAPNN